MKKFQLLALSVFSGLLFWAAWPVSPFTFFIFFAWVPIFYLADFATKRTQFIGYLFIALLLFNASTTWWIWNSTDVGTIAAIVTNTILMCVPCWAYVVFKNRFKGTTAQIAFIACWLLFEYIHLNWQISWPWLTLGNVFAQQIHWVQWYEFTGVAGGSLWILVVNIFVYNYLKQFNLKNIQLNIGKGCMVLLLIFTPIIISYFIEKNKQPIATKYPVVIVQPNIDPYQKFENLSADAQIQLLLKLTTQAIDSNTQLVIWPETALAANVEINDITNAIVYQPVFKMLQQYPKLTLLTGIETYQIYGTEKATTSARPTQQGFYYDSYNAAIILKANQNLQLYKKSKLVPGVETLPSFLNFLAPVFEKFGGTTGGYATDSTSRVLTTLHLPFKVAPVICYESVYGAYVSSYVQKGANLITIITNDGWWGNTPGHKQHLKYASLRAIETRRYIARSANTGISAVINDYGIIEETTAWNQLAVIKTSLPITQKITFYVCYGDYLYYIFSALAVICIVWNTIVWLQEKRNRKKTK